MDIGKQPKSRIEEPPLQTRIEQPIRNQIQQVQRKAKKQAPGFQEDPTLLNELDGNVLKVDLIRSMHKNKKDVGPDVKDIQLDTDLQDLFEHVDVGHGDESMACLPWKGALKKPDSHPPINPTMPDVTYKIDFVYGYKNEEVRQNCFYNNQNEVVYMTAALGVIYKPGNNKYQKYFGGGETFEMVRKQVDNSINAHTDDIMCLCINIERTMCATGQVGHSPIIFVWDSFNAEKKGMFRLPKGTRSVTAIAFNKDSSLIASADFSNDHNVYVHNWRTGQVIFTKKTGGSKIFMIEWSRKADEFFSVGPKHISFWDAKGVKWNGALKNENQGTNLLCVASDLDGNFYTGAQNGSVMKWNRNSMTMSQKMHDGIIYCIRFVQQMGTNTFYLITGASDHTIKIINPQPLQGNDRLQILFNLETEQIPKSVDFGKKFLLVGFKNGTIVEREVSSKGKEEIMHSHHDGELWGLCLIEDQKKFITSGDDNKLYMYDISDRKMVQSGNVEISTNEEKKQQQLNPNRQGGASTTSNEPPERQSRALAYCQKYQHLAVADNLGKVSIRKIQFGEKQNLNNVIDYLVQPNEWIECMSYDPSGSKLAVGSHDNNIYVYTIDKTNEKYLKCFALKAHSSFITALDWSLDSEYIRSNCGAYELLFFNVRSREQDKSGASNTTRTQWATQTCKLGWNVEGIYPEGCDGTHINTVDQCNKHQIIATGDDYGLVNIYRNPVRTNKHAARSFRGHSEHVTKVKFMNEGEYLISIGGMDQTIIQWKLAVPR
ncbi:help domain containing protein [Stylonychia lemnae]|uniref:Help domain containing protein n=1 Tax=Stylonychia lemnae TaxID=5949 RepID=A0A077ZXK3_STYLE|nr:help domain containing protein [Stylonychia lemnae]|eukprot:CDW73957.1 help domain containing protein [Stylonychia lemnae]